MVTEEMLERIGDLLSGIGYAVKKEKFRLWVFDPATDEGFKIVVNGYPRGSVGSNRIKELV